MTTTSHVSVPQQTAQTAPAARSASLWATVRDVYRERRAARAYFQRIERELATYTTPSDLAELDAMIERSDIGADTVYTEMIERIRLRAA